MQPLTTCCQDLPDATPTASPFDSIIALTYYDGPLTGLLRCTVCDSEYWFETVAMSENQDFRVIYLSPVPPGSIAALLEVLKSVRPMRRLDQSPWAPSWIFPSPEDQQIAERQLDTIVASASPPRLELEWTDDTRRILWGKRLRKA
jgi:hypothetical protein